MKNTKQILSEKVESTTTLSPEAVAELGWDLTDSATVENWYVSRKVLDTSMQPTPYGSGESLCVVTTTDDADIAAINEQYALQGLVMTDFSDVKRDSGKIMLRINRSDLMMAEHRRDTIYEVGGVPVMRTGTTRDDYDPDLANHKTDLKRAFGGEVYTRQYSDTGNHYYDLFEDTQLPEIPEHQVRSVYCDDDDSHLTVDRICDDDGPLPGSNWRVVVGGYDDFGDGQMDSVWTSDQIVPTFDNLVEKVNKYLTHTGDFHTFLECIEINHENRTLGVALGS